MSFPFAGKDISEIESWEGRREPPSKILKHKVPIQEEENMERWIAGVENY
jgi:hypothetical protein